ncbi:class I adenylate-forming enzyme family protein [Butyrivibrio sp. AE3003]|uniref:class I adenylate-forming enzyme family protein n=1 Tax=Butyrivibrio sp. AE3003 TaxID=1496721 RepID=UPI00047DB6AB|nr:class I adenylate-forming enzyme family protein [Butyrivibrio sp. AE3003]
MRIQRDYESIEAYLKGNASSQSAKDAIIVKDVHTTYGQLWKYVRGFAKYLSFDCNVNKGDKVVVKATQTLSYCICYFAIHLSGGVFVPLEKSMADEKITNIVKETNAKVYIAIKDIPGLNTKYINTKEVEQLAESNYDDTWEYALPKLMDSADIMYTTGTTGKAKGVEVTHSVLLATADNYISGFEIKKNNVMAVPGPMNHVNPLRKLYMSIKNGSTIIILNGLMNMKAFFDTLDNQGVTSLCLPPAFLRLIWQHSGDKLADYAGQIDFVETSTAPVTEYDKETLRKQLPKSRLYNNYGLSECGAMVMYDFNEYRDKGAGCVGRPMINSNVIIVDDDRRPIVSSKENMGLIANRSSINMKGYYNAPDITAQVLVDGVVYTNDIGYFDEEGFLYVVGRQNDTINIGGLKVEPTDVEEVALTMGEIRDCICTAIDDDITGKALKLYVVVKDGYEFDSAKVIRYLSERLESYQVPKLIETIAEVPRNYVGKPDRNAFR